MRLLRTWYKGGTERSLSPAPAMGWDLMGALLRAVLQGQSHCLPSQLMFASAGTALVLLLVWEAWLELGLP